MAIDNLTDLYIHELKDLYSANDQSKKVTSKLIGEANDDGLKEALTKGVQGIEDGMKAVEDVLSRHDERPSGTHCKGMEGLVKEVQAHVLDESFSDKDTKDAAIITQYQRMAHYAIAGYGCVAQFANRLGHDDDKATLGGCLEATKDGDETMTRLAEGGINEAAA